MRTLRWVAAGMACCLAFYACPAYACRYNVREIGFIDVGIDPYWLFVYSPGETPADAIAVLEERVAGALVDTNIRFELVGADADANHPAMQFLSPHGINHSPTAVLVSPDGPSKRLDLPEGAGSLGEAVSSALEQMLYSPARQQILERAADSYAVVLLVEGPEQGPNTAAREAVSRAINRIAEQLEFLPKPIARAPEMVVLDRKSLAGEEMLLWALGLEPQDINEPHAAVFYGRGRWIGPLFKADVLTADHLTELLFVIGADCECGLDHRWLQGTMLPARWDDELQQKVVESLGFDPENPMIKMEMVSIIRRGMGGFDYPGVPFGYQEIQVGGDTPDTYGQPDVRTPEDELAPVSPQAGAVQADVASERGKTGIGILAASLGGMTVLVAVASAAILLRARRT